MTEERLAEIEASAAYIRREHGERYLAGEQKMIAELVAEVRQRGRLLGSMAKAAAERQAELCAEVRRLTAERDAAREEVRQLRETMQSVAGSLEYTGYQGDPDGPMLRLQMAERLRAAGG